jgi:hypothetical protein
VKLCTCAGGAPAVKLNPTDDALADIFAERRVATSRYDANERRWLHHDGSKWAWDATGLVVHFVRCLLREVHPSLGSSTRIRAVERLARTDPRLALGEPHAAHKLIYPQCWRRPI